MTLHTTSICRFYRFLILFSFLFISSFSEADPQDTLIQVIDLEEHFNVSHPTQIIDFDLKNGINPGLYYLIGPEGKEVPFQISKDRKKIFIQTDLPAGSQKEWRLYQGKSRLFFQDGIKVIEKRDVYEITNRLTAIRIPRLTKSNWRSWKYTPAPVQGILARNGFWTTQGINILSKSAKSIQIKFLEQGPLKVVVEILYLFDSSESTDKSTLSSSIDASFPSSYYRSTIEIQCDQPSILFEEDANTDVAYSLNIYDVVHPDQCRYRGHHSTSKEKGHELDGRQYRPWNERSAMDAFVNLSCDQDREYRSLAVWDPWIYDSGWYWQIYDSKAPPNANLFGVFSGRASRAIGAFNSGVNVFTESSKFKGSQAAAGFRIFCHRFPSLQRKSLMETLRSFKNELPLTEFISEPSSLSRMRFSWGLFVGRKEDLKAPEQIQPIAQQMNLHAGFNLNKIYRYPVTFPDPKRGYGAIYMDKKVTQEMINRLRKDTKGCCGGGYYQYLYNAESMDRQLIDMWADSSGGKAKMIVEEILDIAKALLNAFVNGDGIYDFHFHYWHGGLEMMRKGLWIDSILASDLITSEDKAKLKAVAILFASILWDDDFVPLFKGHGLNLGTENMPIQQQGYRNFYALFLADSPFFKHIAKGVEQDVLKVLSQIINLSGVEIGSPHYVGASFVPILDLLLQIKMLGGMDPFKIENRLIKFSEYYMNFLTPPEVRFGGGRKLVSIGDGSSESSEIFGQLATGFSIANPELSSRLMGAWQSTGKTHSGFFGSTLLSLNEDLPTQDPLLGDACFQDGYSVLRYGWGTPDETALWLINGDFYRDHRHEDQGSMVIYALGAPLSIDWGSMYSPHVSSAFMHNTILPESALGFSWNQDNPPLEGIGFWKKSTQETFLSFQNCSYIKSHFESAQDMKWIRSITLIHQNPSFPIIIINDDFSGAYSENSKILSLNLMAGGSVKIPGDIISPFMRNYGHNNELPSNGKIFELATGINCLNFTGQYLIDWDLYMISSEPQEAYIGNWAHTWHPNKEQNEFLKSQGHAFEERQHILRIKGKKPFKTLIFPYRKGQKKIDFHVEQKGKNILVLTDNSKTVISNHFYTYKTKEMQVLSTFRDRKVKNGKIQVQGGPVEIIFQKGRIDLTVHGHKGIRKINLPDGWKVEEKKDVQSSIKFEKDGCSVDYQDDSPQTFVLRKI